MLSLVMMEQVPGFQQYQGFLNSAIWSPGRALGLLMPEPHKKPPVWEVASMAKAHPAIREGWERLVLRPNIQKFGCIVSSPQAESALRDSSTRDSSRLTKPWEA